VASSQRWILVGVSAESPRSGFRHLASSKFDCVTNTVATNPPSLTRRYLFRLADWWAAFAFMNPNTKGVSSVMFSRTRLQSHHCNTRHDNEKHHRHFDTAQLQGSMDGSLTKRESFSAVVVRN
jgi:hypothetical protein